MLDDAATARDTVGTPEEVVPGAPPPGGERCGKALEHFLGRSEPGAGNLRTWGGGWKEAGCRSTCTDPLLLCPPAGPGGGGPLLLPQWGGECPRLPRWRSSLATGVLLRSSLERVVGRHGWCGWGRPGSPELTS